MMSIRSVKRMMQLRRRRKTITTESTSAYDSVTCYQRIGKYNTDQELEPTENQILLMMKMDVLNWTNPYYSLRSMNQPYDSNSYPVKTYDRHNTRATRLGAFTDLPSEVRWRILDNLMPTVVREINLLEPNVKRESLHDCIGNLIAASPYIKRMVGHWHLHNSPKFGFFDDPIFGLINPVTTQWYLSTSERSWAGCTKKASRCSWESGNVCTDPECPKAILLKLPTLPWQSRSLIQRLTVTFLSDVDMVHQTSIEDADQLFNVAVIETVPYLTDLKRIDFKLYFKPQGRGWRDYIKEFVQETGGRQFLPLGSLRFAEGVPTNAIVNVYDCWSPLASEALFSIDTKPRLLSTWRNKVLNDHRWPSIGFDSNGFQSAEKGTGLVAFEIKLAKCGQHRRHESLRNSIPLWYIFPHAINWILKTTHDYLAYDVLLSDALVMLRGKSGDKPRPGLRVISRTISRLVEESRKPAQEETMDLTDAFELLQISPPSRKGPSHLEKSIDGLQRMISWMAWDNYREMSDSKDLNRVAMIRNFPVCGTDW